MITKKALKSLICDDPHLAISLFMPLKSGGLVQKDNEILLSNLLRDAKDGIDRTDDTDRLLDRLEDYVAAEKLLTPSREISLALYCTDSGCMHYSIPAKIEAEIFVEDHFVVKPLLKFLDPGERYYIITLDQANPTLWQANWTGVEPVAEQIMQDSMGKIRGMTELAGNAGFHSSSNAGASRHADAQHHAQGDSPPDYKQVQLEEYVQGVAKAVDEALKNETHPLVAVGSPNLLGMYRKHAEYAGLLDEGVDKAPQNLSEEELHLQTWRIAERPISKQREETLGRLMADYKRGDRKAVLHKDMILRRAVEGRIETLLIDAEQLNSLYENDATLGEKIVRETLTHGGSAMLVPADALPQGAPAAALLRH